MDDHRRQPVNGGYTRLNHALTSMVTFPGEAHSRLFQVQAKIPIDQADGREVLDPGKAQGAQLGQKELRDHERIGRADAGQHRSALERDVRAAHRGRGVVAGDGRDHELGSPIGSALMAGVTRAVPPLMTPSTRPDWYSSSKKFSRAWLIALLARPPREAARPGRPDPDPSCLSWRRRRRTVSWSCPRGFSPVISQAGLAHIDSASRLRPSSMLTRGEYPRSRRAASRLYQFTVESSRARNRVICGSPGSLKRV